MELDFFSDDELPNDFTSQPECFNASIIPPLSPTLILLYLSISYLKLGLIFLPTSNIPLSQSIPMLLICAAFAMFTRWLWYLLARYLQKMDIEEVVLDVFAWDSDKTHIRILLRVIVRLGTFVMWVLLASASLRGSYIPSPLLFLKLTYCSFCWCIPSSCPRTIHFTCPRAPYC